MARKNNPYLLFAISTCLLSGGWMMKSFPLFIFSGFAPLFAITDQVNQKKSFWNYFELILLALSISLFASYVFDTQFIVPVLIESIIFTCAFVGYAFAKRSLGPWLGKFCILIFWLGIEYVFLKLSWPTPTLFLADSLLLKTGWVHGNHFTGYLGASAWILTCNLVLYYSVLKSEKANLPLLVLYLLCVVGPIVYSLLTAATMITRDDMIVLYDHAAPETSPYATMGEYIPRTAAIISGLILIFAVIRNKPQKT